MLLTKSASLTSRMNHKSCLAMCILPVYDRSSRLTTKIRRLPRVTRHGLLQSNPSESTISCFQSLFVWTQITLCLSTHVFSSKPSFRNMMMSLIQHSQATRAKLDPSRPMSTWDPYHLHNEKVTFHSMPEINLNCNKDLMTLKALESSFDLKMWESLWSTLTHHFS